MSDVTFDSALSSIQKPQDTRRLLKILIVIRKGIEWPDNKDNVSKLRVCLPQLVQCLKVKNGSVLDVTLSILGNCCMNERNARGLVMVYNLLPQLTELLEHNPKHDSINGRAFRIIGNVCKQSMGRLTDYLMQHDPKLVDAIVNFLKSCVNKSGNRVSSATINMCIRSLRALLNACSASALVSKHNVLLAICVLLGELTPRWVENKSHENILDNLIRLLHEFSRYQYPISVSQLCNNEQGNALLHLCHLVPLSPRRIVKIMMNLAKLSSLKSELPIPELCKSLMDNITRVEDSNTERATFKEYLQCLCLLLEEPGNRVHTRNSESVPFLIKVLGNFKTPDEFTLECSILILITLKKCMYNDRTVLMLTKSDLINVLTEKLEWIVGSPSFSNIKHTKYSPILRCHTPAKKLKNNLGLSSDIPQYLRSPSSNDEDFFTCFFSMDRCCSPSSSSEMSFSSGPSSPSPSSPMRDNPGESDSDDYSPVCSESDERDFPLVLNDPDEKQEMEENYHRDEFRHVDFSMEEDYENSEELGGKDSSGVFGALKNSLVDQIAKILLWFSNIRPVIPELGNANLLTLLALCAKDVNSQSPVGTLKIIMNILESQEYLLPLMQTDFIPVMYDVTLMPHGISCANCRQLRSVGQKILSRITDLAESGCGKGDIAHHLIRADQNVKQKLVLVIPYIVRHKLTLSKLMIDCGGLNVLMKLLLEKSDLQWKGIKVVCAMAFKHLGIKNPIDLTSSSKKFINTSNYALPKDCTNIVTFKLDDGSCVKADRDFLSDKSVYFDRMLNGQFRESQEDEIALCNVKNKSFKCLLKLLSCEVTRTQTLQVDLDLPTLLDVIALTDRYLLPDLCVSLTCCVEQQRINRETVSVIYRWSLESGTNILRVESVAFALVCNMLDSERVEMFKKLFELGYTEELVEDIRKLLERFLSMRFRD